MALVDQVCRTSMRYGTGGMMYDKQQKCSCDKTVSTESYMRTVHEDGDTVTEMIIQSRVSNSYANQ